MNHLSKIQIQLFMHIVEAVFLKWISQTKILLTSLNNRMLRKTMSKNKTVTLTLMPQRKNIHRMYHNLIVII